MSFCRNASRSPWRQPVSLWVLLLLCCSLASLVGTDAWAQPPADPPDKQLAAARQQLTALQKSLDDKTPDGQLVELRNQAAGLQAKSDALAQDLGPKLANVEARVAELGEAPATGEGADVATQRAALNKERSLLDAQVKLARLVAVESGQAMDRILEMRRSRFQARLFEQTDSVFSTDFWEELATSAGRDGWRLRGLFEGLRQGAATTPARIWISLLVAVVAVLALFVRARAGLLRFSSTRVPAGRLRRSAFATVNVVLPTVASGVIAMLLALGPSWTAPLSREAQALVELLAGALIVATYIASLGYSLLSPRRPSWRLPPLPDSFAAGMRRYPLLLGLAFGTIIVVEQTIVLANLSLATAVVVNAVVAIALTLLQVRMLLMRRRAARRALAADGDGVALVLPWWVSVLGGAIWALVLGSLACVVLGYVALGSFIAKQIIWIAVVAASAYLLGALVDDAFMSLLGGGNSPGNLDTKAADEEVRPYRLRTQAAVLLSGASRVVITLTALVLVLAPFGEGPEELLSRAGSAGEGVAIGAVQVRPGLVVEAMLVLAIALLSVRLVQRWFGERFLPTTQIDPGMRSSVTTLLGYLGIIAAISLALSAVGLGLERVAWVASALSVGIGFGLQAVVSNFVSGLILLAERPVKVGDWVSLGGVEGDIRRINVRATEIQMGDRSTVIVPNSEFITKTVRNLTMANPLGLVSIKLPMPLDTDVERMRALLLAAFAEHPDVLEAPAPSVHLDGIDAGNLIFAASGSVSSPRKSYGVKSALLFDILRRVREARLPMGKSPTMVLQAPPAESGGG